MSLDDEHVDQLLAASPYYTKHVIPAGTYNGQDEDVTTVAVGAVILARDDVSEDAIYALTADIFDNAAELDQQPRQVRRAVHRVRRVHHLRALSSRRCQVLRREGLRRRHQVKI